MEFKDKTKVSELACCPPLQACKNCDTIDVKYRLPFRPQTQRGRVVPVEVLLHFRFERCSGELTLGDLAYTSTLMPGEQVRLFTSDRNTRWTFDSETNLSYRNETTSEESFLMAGMASAVSDLSIIDNGNSRSSYSESAVSGGGGAGLDLGFIQIGGSAAASSFNAQSASEFARNFSQHAESSSRHVEAGVRAASSTSIGEVERRSHAEGESESHFEASSRLFKNPNRCHALTFFFYKMNKCQTLCFDLVAIERRVVDPASPTGAERRPALPSSKVTILPKAVLSTNVNRLETGRIARASAAEESLDSASIARRAILGSRVLTTATLASVVEPISDTDRKAALAAVDKDLAAAGLIDQESGEVTKKAKARFSWKRETTLPTAGVIVKGCLDECNVCEPELQEEMKIDLERKRLENDLLKRQVDLLDQSQEYRCCPEGEAEEELAPNP